MQTKIRTKQAISFDASNLFKKSVVEIALMKWVEEDGVYTAITQDNIVEKKTIQSPKITETGISLTDFEEKEVVSYTTISQPETFVIGAEQYNQLSQYAKSVAPKEMTDYKFQEFKKKIGLFFTITNDFYKDENGDVTDRLKYSTGVEDWEIVND